MRIPSDKKIVLQAKAYCNSHPVIMSPAWEKLYGELNKEHSELSQKFWNHSQHCPAQDSRMPCTCKEQSWYAPIMDILLPLSTRINTMYTEKADMERAIYSNCYGILYRARMAKEKYRQMRNYLKHIAINADMPILFASYVSPH